MVLSIDNETMPEENEQSFVKKEEVEIKEESDLNDNFDMGDDIDIAEVRSCFISLIYLICHTAMSHYML